MRPCNSAGANFSRFFSRARFGLRQNYFSNCKRRCRLFLFHIKLLRREDAAVRRRGRDEPAQRAQWPRAVNHDFDETTTVASTTVAWTTAASNPAELRPRGVASPRGRAGAADEMLRTTPTLASCALPAAPQLATAHLSRTP